MSGDNDAPLRSRTDRSKQRKADEKRLADLAAVLAGLSAKQLGRLELDEALRDAVQETRRLTAYAARARQLRVVRRELRGCDNQAIGAAVEALLHPSGGPSPAARAAHAWVDRFLAEGSAAIESFVSEHEHADRQRLEALIHNACKADISKITNARKSLAAAAVKAVIEQARPKD